MKWVCVVFISGLVAETRQPLIWRDPGAVESLDFADPFGSKFGPPQAPFTFYMDEPGGTSPKLLVRDANKRTWIVKFGPEAKAEVFANRMLRAAGYFAEPTYFVPAGRIDSVGAITKASEHIDRSNGNSFSNARFQLYDNDAHFLPTANWTIVNNPFRGTPQLNGMKIMIMLLSNWDFKDARSSDGPNTALVEYADNELRYVISDWGGTMGKWGNIAVRSKWDCGGYASQTEDFIKGVSGALVEFGYSGKRADDIRRGITVNDVRWLMQYLGRISDEQLQIGLTASGASPDEVRCFTQPIRSRIGQLAKIAGRTTSPVSGE